MINPRSRYQRLHQLALVLCFAGQANTHAQDLFREPQLQSTTKPTEEMVEHCRKIMHLDPQLELQPLGFCYFDHFMDDAIAFKFKTKRTDRLFKAEFVSSDELKRARSTRELGLHLRFDEEWWNPQEQELIGGQFTVPLPGEKGVRGLCIGIANNDDETLTVYVYWFET